MHRYDPGGADNERADGERSACKIGFSKELKSAQTTSPERPPESTTTVARTSNVPALIGAPVTIARGAGRGG
jgi:hypothetical protein